MNVVGIVHRETGSDGGDVYGVHFPDFPGATSGGSTFAEICEKAGVMLAFHVESMVEDGDAMPARLRTTREVAATLDCGTEDAYAQLIVVSIPDYPLGTPKSHPEDQI